MAETVKEQCVRRLEGLKSARQPQEDAVRELFALAAPHRGSLATFTASGKKRKGAVIRDEYGIGAFRTLANGMTSGLSSSSSQWFALGYEQEELADLPDVKAWLDPVQKRLERRFHLSNFYDAAKSTYAELGLAGTGACLMVDDAESVIVCHPLTFGDYWIAAGPSGVVDMLYRRIAMTTKQAVEQFGNRCRQSIRDDYDRSEYQTLHTFYHAIDRAPAGQDDGWFSKPWRSIYWDEGDTRSDATLEVGGYHEKPFWAPRWDVVPGTPYGYGPGHDSIASLRELQLQTMRKNEAIDLMVRPPLIVANASIKINRGPNAINEVPGATASDIFAPFIMPYQAPAAIQQEIERCKQRIDVVSYADLFMAITNMNGVQPRNIEEIASRNEEKMTQLGPVVERVNKEMLGVAIDRMFGIMERGRLLPPPPESLQDKDLSVTFTSVLARMQRAIGIGQIERSVGFVGNLAGVDPGVIDKVDLDAAVEEYFDRAGAPSKLIRSKDQVAEIRNQRAQQQQAAQMAQMMPAIQQGADAARLLSETDVGGAPILDQVLGQ